MGVHSFQPYQPDGSRAYFTWGMPADQYDVTSRLAKQGPPDGPQETNTPSYDKNVDSGVHAHQMVDRFFNRMVLGRVQTKDASLEPACSCTVEVGVSLD